MGAVTHARSTHADPQSGPALPRGVTGFFHYNARWIVAEQGSIAGLGKSNYINRVGEFAEAPSRDPLAHDGGRSSPGTVLATSNYISRTEGAADDELGASILITRGLPVDTGVGLARLLDARERKRDRTYRCYGGRLPRVGSHFILSFRYGLSAEAATKAAWEHARMLSDRLRVPLEGRVHNKNGAPDHLHLIVGTRVVDQGKLGRKCRALDAVSEKHDGKSLVEGVLGPTIEALRADWAERMRRASGDMEIDHRSYVRRGVAIYPVAHVARSKIEWQKRRGRVDWRHERSLELQDRAAVLRNEAAKPDREPRQHALGVATPVPGVDRGSVEVAQARRADLGTRPVREDGDTASGSPASKEVESGRGLAAPGIDAAPMIAAYRTLKRAHRLTAGRERALATLTGVDVEAFRRAAADATHDGVGAPDDGAGAAAQARPLPVDLMKLIVVWQDEDLRARAEKRRGGKANGEAGIADQPPDPAVPDPAVPGRALLAGRRIGSGEGRSGDAGAPAPPHVQNDEASPYLIACAGAHAELRRRHRLSEVREQRLAGFAGVSVAALRLASEQAPANAGQSIAATVQTRPVALVAVLAAWAHDDRQARAARRKGEGRVSRVETAPAPTRDPGGGAPMSPGSRAMVQSAGAPPPRAARPHARPFDPAQINPGPGVAPAVAPQAGPAAAAASDVLARALGQAHADDVLARAYDAGRPPPSDAEMLGAVAHRLRASGFDRDEVASCLRAGVTPARPDDAAQIEPAVTRAFSDRTTAWLAMAPGYREHAIRISDRAETATWRRLRNDAISQLKHDLDDVWATRRADVEAVIERHRRALSFVHGLRQDARKLRRRGVVLAILSLLVELAIYQPLLALEIHRTAQDRRDVNDAAAEASAALKMRRAEWVAAICVPRAGAVPDHAGGDRRARKDVVSREGQSHRPAGAVICHARAAEPAPQPAVRSAKDVRALLSDSPRRRGTALSSRESRRLRFDLQTPSAGKDANDKVIDLSAAARAASDPLRQRMLEHRVRQAVSRPQQAPRRLDGRMASAVTDKARAVDTTRSEGPAMTATDPSDVAQQKVARPTPVRSVTSPNDSHPQSGREVSATPHRAPATAQAGPMRSDDGGAARLPDGAAVPVGDHVPALPIPGSLVRDEPVAGSKAPPVGEERAATTPAVGNAELSQSELRRLTIDFAVLVAADKLRSIKRIRALAAVARMSVQQLRDGVSRRVEELAGTAGAQRLEMQVVRQLQQATWKAAKAAGHGELLRVMRALSRDDDDDGGGPGGRSGPGGRNGRGGRNGSDGPGSR